MTGGDAHRISDDILWEDYYTNLYGAYDSMRGIFDREAKDGLSQDHIAKRLNIDKALVSRRLNGRENLTLKTLSFTATAMNCRLVVTFQPYEEVAGNNHFSRHDWSVPDDTTGNTNKPVDGGQGQSMRNPNNPTGSQSYVISDRSRH